MPYDGSGNFTRLYNWTADKLAAIKIQSTRMDAEFDNYATALNSVILRSGVAPFTGDVKLGGNKITGLSGGSLGTPSLQFTGDLTTGMYLPAAGVLGFQVGGVDRLRLGSNGGYLVGNLGVGAVTAPRTALDVGSGLTSISGAFETHTLTATAITGTVNIDYKTQALVIYDSNAAGNFSFNIRGDSVTTLDSIMAIGQTCTLAVEVPQGATAFYCTAITVDGAAPSQLKWFGGAPTNGNASGIDIYTVTVIKKAANTFYVRASQAQAK